MDVFFKKYYQPRKVISSKTWILIVLDANILDLQTSFKITLMSNVQWAMD